MKIALIHNQLSRSGGMESYLFALINGFAAAGDEVHVHTYEVDRDTARSLPCIVHRMRLGFLPRRLKKYAFLQRCNSRFDRTAYDLSLSLTRTACPDIAVIGGVHPSSVVLRGGSNVYRRLNDRLETAFERKMLVETPHVLAHSKAVAAEIKQHYTLDTGKIKVIYPPVDTTVFQPVSRQVLEAARLHYRLAPGKMTFLFPSHDHRRKGLQELLAAFAGLDPSRYELLVAGEGLRNFSNLPAGVRYIGNVEHLAAVYGIVDYSILPSRYEPFGLVIIESLQCGTPVLVTRGAGASELLSDEEGVILDDNRPETIRQAILDLTARQVRPDFVQRHGLGIAEHIERIKALGAS
ncbi:D-inositol 3-phosphate glycosyltransferase [bacterium BMS3Bbin14]|nr:D-inositol 3-phosphate glycosyltransferase [bacterium BMS3Abin13]GBE51727.1 D-inositol 3-phosphate glycosyltransferase [bacterium BMS3Bbin14]HDK44135.1 glycosyltransferase [Desulfobacteraceae bacterium]HDL98837.1 glycosyltransferase [Desulfobacteraceae bacterium]HDO30789.1 glycosyltransferase [Desulfobacteraceae bacterium]